MSTNFLNKLSCTSSLNNLKIDHEISNISNIHCSYGSVCLHVFVLYLLFSLHPLILFCFARKRQGNVNLSFND